MRHPHHLPLTLALAALPLACAPAEAGATPHHAAPPREPAAPLAQPAVTRTLTATATVDLNHASADELMRLPGVGKKRAEVILARRAKRRFRTVEELRALKGFGPKLYLRLRPRLRALP